MKYGIVIKQEGEGCDYTIGCGTRFVEFDAPDDVAARDWVREQHTPDEDNTRPYLAGENNETTFERVTLVKIVEVLPIEAWRDEVAAKARNAIAKRDDAAEKAELQRLLKRHGVPC